MPEATLSERDTLAEEARVVTCGIARQIVPSFPHHGNAILRQLAGERSTLDRWNRVAQVGAALFVVPGAGLTRQEQVDRRKAMQVEGLALAVAHLYWTAGSREMESVRCWMEH